MIIYTMNYLAFISAASILSILDLTFTYWFLLRLKKNGVQNSYKRELNPLARFIMKKFGVGVVSLIINGAYIQALIWTMYHFFPQFGMFMLGALVTVFSYHLGVYREMRKFKNDKHFWKLVRYKMNKIGD